MIKTVCLVLLLTAFSDARSTNSTSRILGGDNVSLGMIPYQAALQYWGTTFFFAGGTLLNSRWVLTTAHGLIGRGPTSVNIALGIVRLDSPFTARQSMEIRMHPLFNVVTLANDIGLVRSTAAIGFNANIAPIDLFPTFVNDGTVARVSGWGATAGDKTGESIILQSTMVTTGPCENTEFMTFTATNHFCAGGSDPTRAICTRDVGGPLVLGNHLIGIPFYHDPRECGVFLDGYLRISFYRNWISGNIPL